MNDVNLQDLKQFWTAALDKQSTQLQTEFHAQFGQLRLEMKDLKQYLEERVDGVEDRIGRVEQSLKAEISDLSAAVAEAIETSNDAAGGQLSDHERRIGRLEERLS